MPGSHLFTAESNDVEELVASMTRDLMHWRLLAKTDGEGTKCRLMYKVLLRIRASDPNAYEPRVLSVGPYHQGAPSLVSMQKEKWLCLDYVLKLNCNRSLHDYLAAIAELEREVRMCYAEENIINSRTFVEMLLLDSCFILVCLDGIGGIRVEADGFKGFNQKQDVLTDIIVGRTKSGKTGKETMWASTDTLSSVTNEEDYVIQVEHNLVQAHRRSNLGSNTDSYLGKSEKNVDPGEQWYNSSAVYDLLLLENQIPFFVVTKVYQILVNNESNSHRLLTDNLAKFVEGVLFHLPLAIQDTNRPKDFDHLLHLCYMYFKPSCSKERNHQMKNKASCVHNLLFWGIKYLGIDIGSQQSEENPLPNAHSKDMFSVMRWRRAEEYHEAGVEFMERVFDEHNPHCLLDVEFRDGILHIPCLPIDDKSGILFRNLLAFEQNCPTLGNDIASYVYFVSQLISVPDDVALLSRKGVIVHQLDSDEEVSALFTRLFDYVIFDFSGEHYLKSLCHSMEAHYQNRVNRWMAWLWHKHFGNPWLGFTALASVVMVFCSIGQTILAFLSYMSMP